MKEFLEKIHTFLLFMRVGSVCVGAIFLLFWFYRFFNLPFAHTLAFIFDLPTTIFPLPLETLETYEGHVVQNAYFIDAIFCGVFAFIFYILEKIMHEVQRQYDMHDVRSKKAQQIQMNKELEKEYLHGVYEYDYFSIYIKYKVEYLSEVLAHNNPYSPEDVLKETYQHTASAIMRNIKGLSVKNNGNFIFITGKDFNSLEEIIYKIAAVIKIIKKQNEKKFMKTAFIIAADVQTNAEESSASYKKLDNIGNLEYYNKALVTLTFKTRFELCKSKRYSIDILGFAATDKSVMKDNTDIYILKSKNDSF